MALWHEQSPPSLKMRDGGQVGAPPTCVSSENTPSPQNATVPSLETREGGVVVDLRLAFRVRGGWGGGRNVPSLETREGGGGG